MGDLRQSDSYKKHLENIGWKVDKAAGIHVFVKRLPPFGSVAKIQRPPEIDFEAINYSIKTHKVFQVIIEPISTIHYTLITKHGFKQSKSPYLPSKTLHLDLTNSIDNLFSQLKKDARYSLRKTKDVKVYAIDKIDKFRKSWKEASGFRRYVPSHKELESLINSFGENALFLVTPGGETGAIFLHAKNTAYYWQAFSNQIGRNKLYQYKILWTGISWAKQMGARVFDFEGIYDERFPNKKWLGFTHFKKSFGGYEVKYPGAFSKINILRR
jgi:lipid II:glycine glycyltransferase (peptidoglycan interpeptide bridge formation enzyme)